MKKHIFYLFFLILCGNFVFAGIGLPKKRAMIIAIGHYAPESGFPGINVENDVIYILKALKNFGFNENVISVLRDSAATYYSILAAMDRLYFESGKGDIIHVHFSGAGIKVKDINNDESDGWDEAFAPYDISAINKEHIRMNYLNDDVINQWITRIRKKVGPAGQVVISMDFSYSGPDEVEISNDRQSFISTRGGFIDVNKTGDIEDAPYVLFTACLSNQYASEVENELGEMVGAWSYAFYKASNLILAQQLNEKKSPVYKDLGDLITASFHNNGLTQTPVTAGFIQSKIYQSDDSKKKSNSASVSSNVYVLSIGISNYKAGSSFSFANCQRDAGDFSNLIQEQQMMYSTDSSRIIVNELFNEEATYQNIMDRLNSIISSARPEDYFFFNFSGFTWQLPDAAGNQETYFFPYVTYDISRTEADEFNNLSDKISLRQLRDLMEFIPAQNQLLVTEAGLTPKFKTEFAKAMIETSPTISQLARRNRVIIVPEEFGRDSYNCNGNLVQGGPLCNFLKQAGSQVSLFGLFSLDEKVREATKYTIQRQEFLCKEFSEPYMSFFFERDFVNELQYFVGDFESQSRGTELLEDDATTKFQGIGQPYALIIGTNNYSAGSPNWKDLVNPIEDATEMSRTLKEIYGYNTRLLLDPPVDTLIAVLKNYSQLLNENDQFVFYIAGHGDYDPWFFDDGFVVLSNSLPLSEDPYRRTYLPFTQLKNIIDNLEAKQILLIIDVCFGGAFDAKISSGPGRSRNDLYSDISVERLLKEKLPLKTRIVLSSGSLNEVPDGYKGKHSPFAARLITCLQTRGGQGGYLTTIQMYDFVQRLPSKPLRGELDGNEGGAEFFLISK